MIEKVMDKEISEILEQAKSLAIRYKNLTGKPLGITGEIAEFSAAKELNLKLAKAREKGYDATNIVKKKEKKIQIKGRCIVNKSFKGRLGSISLKSEWDSVLLVLFNNDYEIIGMYEAKRNAVVKAINKPGSKARNERGQLNIKDFIDISKKVV